MKRLKGVSISSIATLCIIIVGWSGPCVVGEDEEISAPMKRTEKEALYSAIQGFVGKWWNGSDLYPDPCGWTPIQGVSCDLFNGFWYATDISIGPIHDNSLTCDKDVKFSSHLVALSHLRSLSFFNCFVSKEHPVTMPINEWEAMAGSLESLEFRSNPGLVGGIPVSFRGFKRLQSLVLMENGLTGEVPQSLGNLTDLKRLSLAGNSFTGGIPASLGGLKQLLILDMSRNSLSGELPASLGILISLLKLDLSSNQLTGSIPEGIGNLKNVTLLDMSNNGLTGGLPESITELIALQELSLSNNPIGGEITNLQWSNLRSITALGLSNTSLSGRIPENIAEIKSLRFLGLNDNTLTGVIPQKLGDLPNISAIYIQGNNLTGELRFPESFYGRLGQRFRAWGNPNLCFSPDSIQAPSNAPSGVKQCARQGIIKYETRIGNSSKHDDHQSSSASSLSLLPPAPGFLFLVVQMYLLDLNIRGPVSIYWARF
ncbi:hypothetical protein M569_10811 [Genlisea aurea]|uniref:Leucine-rich repeat-containing N-terminal plant-type domain-containing protein n=1 Tax=Genlisea aurea TaxID=192259 RepID=S8CAM9_9LAMI|nr:hypothetical protein M569_10811 [Genlisea aurea]